MDDKLREEINRRRTFAIISHPDAGKTTLTEKFLLFGGAINTAGSVKGKANSKYAVSDWMDIEKERGISVTSSVLQFNYDGYCINILDTPGHQDFSEDTYRTLMAADSAVMVIDASKGVEAQTIKLFKVCVMRHIPIFTFINKMDRDARDTFELLDDIETVLGIKTCPVNWPIGSGKEFKGVYDRKTKIVSTFQAISTGGAKKAEETDYHIDDEALKELVGPYLFDQFNEEIELIDGATEEMDIEKVRAGELSPVFFGSALNTFGIEQFLNYFLFAPEKQHNYVYKLSGGEKRRLYLCTVLMRSPNFLVLDEPTNDLDIVTLNVLEEYLRNFKGCAIVVSHDRYFMDKVVDHLLVFRGNADIKDFPGNYTQYREWKEVQDQLEKETEAARQARMAPTVEKTSRLEKVQKKKLTFKERKEFEALEVEISLLEAEKAELETAMSSGTLSNDELLAKSERIAKVIEEIDEKTMRWLELSELA